MPEEEHERVEERNPDSVPELPEVPAIPELPEAPQFKPKLPPRRVSHDTGKEYRQMGTAYTLPAALVAPILVLTFAGYWLDGHFHTGSRYTLGGALLGTLVGFINMFRMASKLND